MSSKTHTGVELLNQDRFWKSHMKNLKEKTIIKNKVHLGDI